MKKKVIVLSLVVILTTMLAFGSTMGLAAQNDKEVVVRIITSTGSLAKALPDYIKKFNELNKGKIRVEAEAESLNSLLQKLMTQFIAKVPTYDIVPVDTKWSRRFEKFVAPLDPFLKKDKLDAKELFGEKVVASRSTRRGVLTSMPVSSAAHILFYRTDLFAAANLSVPKTLDEYLAAARKLTKRSPSGAVEVYGMGGLRSLAAGDDTPTLAYFLQPRGGRVLNASKTDASPDLKKPVTVEVLQFMNTMVKEGLCPNPLSWDQYADRPAFAQGKLAMSVVYSPIASMIEDPKQSKVAGKVGYAVIKLDKKGSAAPAAYSSGWGLAIDKNSPNKQAAWEFIKFITANFETQKAMAMSGLNDPSLLQVLSDSEYSAKVKSVGPIKEIMTKYGFDMASDVEQGTEIELIIHEELQLMYLERKTPQQTANALYDRIHKLMTGK